MKSLRSRVIYCLLVVALGVLSAPLSPPAYAGGLSTGGNTNEE